MSQPSILQRHSWLAPVLAGLAHAVLLGLAAHPFNLCLLSPFAVMPLLWFLIRGTSKPWRDALLLMVGVSPVWLLWEWWMTEVTLPGFPFFILLQTSWTALFYAVARMLHRRWPRIPWSVAGPLAWVAVEFFRGEYFLSGYASGLLAYPMIEVPRLASPAAWFGVYFVSFLLSCIGFGLSEFMWAGERRRWAAGAVAWALIVWCSAAWLVPRGPDMVSGVPSRTIRPGILQTNVAQSNKIAWSLEEEISDWQRFSMLTRMLAEQPERPQFMMWPETMMPGDTLEPSAMAEYQRADLGQHLKDGGFLPGDAFYNGLLALQQEIALPMLVGEDALVNLRVMERDKQVRKAWDARYNSAYLVMNGAVQPVRYDKACLTPFGETMPVISRWPWLANQLLDFGAHGMSFDLAAGETPTVFNIPLPEHAGMLRVVTPICFETTVGHHCRNLVFARGVRRADLIASLTNDGWFGDSDIARRQHLQVARWRCVELATPMARAANTGISAIFDCDGQLVAAGVQGTETSSKLDGVLTGTVALCSRTTLFARVGNVFPGIVTILVSGALVPAFFRRKTPLHAEESNGSPHLPVGITPKRKS